MAVQIPMPSENLLQLFKIKEYFQTRKEAEELAPQIKEELQLKKKKKLLEKGTHGYTYIHIHSI